MDTFESLSSIETFEQFVAQESLCIDIANSRLKSINKDIASSEDNLNLSRYYIEESFQNILLILDNWKTEFIKELEEAVKEQQSTLLHERDSLTENIEKFKKYMFSAKINVKACQESQLEATALNFLETLSPIVNTLLEEENFYYPVTYVPNKDFVKSFFKYEDKHKIGFIKYQPVDVETFRLEPRECQPCIGSTAIFEINTSSKQDFESLSKYFSWKVSTEDRIIEANLKDLNNTYVLQFLVLKNVNHEVSFFLFNQHISGSPCTILPILKQEPQKFYAHEFETKPKIAIEKLKIHPSPEIIPVPTKLVDRTSSSLKPPRALNQHGKITSVSDDTDQLCAVNCGKEPVLNGAIKLSEKLIDRSVRINKPSTIRKPFTHARKIESKVKDISNRICELNAKNPIDHEFKPVVSSEDISDPLQDACSMANASTFNDSMKPGQKTLLLNECILKTEYAPTVNERDMVISSECDGIFNHKTLCIKTDGNNNNDVLNQLKKEPEDTEYCTGNRFTATKKKAKHSQESEDMSVTPDNSFHTFLQVGLTAKWQVCFTGNEKVQMKCPIGIAELKNENIVVADTFNNRLLLFNNNASFICEFNNGSKQFNQPSAIDILPDGSFAVKDNHSITTFSQERQPLKVFGNKILSRPYGITHDNNGNIITIDVGTNGMFSIVKIDPSSGILMSRVTANIGSQTFDSKLSKPRFITFRDPNELLVVDLGLNLVYILKIDTGNLVSMFGGSGTAPGKFNDPSGIVCDAEGYMFIGDSRNHRIQVFAPEGKYVCILKVDRPLKRPSGLHLTPAGQLYVLNYWENSFVKYAFAANKPLKEIKN